tara:strand:- start:53 stop:901 length:849 start_codon:yes stop_codon:yes gene_type:complete
MSRRIDLSNQEEVPTVTDEHDVDLGNILRSQDAQPDETRVGQDYLHVSALLGGFCARREWLKRNVGYQHNNQVSGGMRIVWALGRAAETHVRDQLLKTMRGNAWGRWGCTHCDAIDGARMYRANTGHSDLCEGTLDVYHEPQLIDERNKITGSTDFVWQHRGKLNIIEIKSMNKKEFDTMTRVKGDHMNQAEVYRYLLVKNGHQVDRADVIVVAKDFVFGSPYKVYASDKNPDARPRVSLLIEDAARDAMQEDMPNKLPQCSARDSSRARGCEACSLCFDIS